MAAPVATSCRPIRRAGRIHSASRVIRDDTSPETPVLDGAAQAPPVGDAVRRAVVPRLPRRLGAIRLVDLERSPRGQGRRRREARPPIHQAGTGHLCGPVEHRGFWRGVIRYLFLIPFEPLSRTEEGALRAAIARAIPISVHRNNGVEATRGLHPIALGLLITLVSSVVFLTALPSLSVVNRADGPNRP